MPESIHPGIYFTLAAGGKDAVVEGQQFLAQYYNRSYEAVANAMLCVTGSWDEVIDWMEKYIEAGARTVVLRFAANDQLAHSRSLRRSAQSPRLCSNDWNHWNDWNLWNGAQRRISVRNLAAQLCRTASPLRHSVAPRRLRASGKTLSMIGLILRRVKKTDQLTETPGGCPASNHRSSTAWRRSPRCRPWVDRPPWRRR